MSFIKMLVVAIACSCQCWCNWSIWEP